LPCVGLYGLSQISFRFPAETLEELITSTTLDVYSILVDIPLAIITIKVIKNYSQKENLIVNVILKDLISILSPNRSLPYSSTKYSNM